MMSLMVGVLSSFWEATAPEPTDRTVMASPSAAKSAARIHLPAIELSPRRVVQPTGCVTAGRPSPGGQDRLYRRVGRGGKRNQPECGPTRACAPATGVKGGPGASIQTTRETRDALHSP